MSESRCPETQSLSPESETRFPLDCDASSWVARVSSPVAVLARGAGGQHQCFYYHDAAKCVLFGVAHLGGHWMRARSARERIAVDRASPALVHPRRALFDLRVALSGVSVALTGVVRVERSGADLPHGNRTTSSPLLL